MARIIVQTDDGKPFVHELGTGVVTIGRDTDNALIIADASVSRHHAEIICRNGTTILRDLNSANGSIVNGELVAEWPLKKGDVIYFGTVQTTFFTDPAVAIPLPEDEARRKAEVIPVSLVQSPLLAAPAAAPATKSTNEESITAKKVALVPPALLLPRLAATPPAKPINEASVPAKKVDFVPSNAAVTPLAVPSISAPAPVLKPTPAPVPAPVLKPAPTPIPAPAAPPVTKPIDGVVGPVKKVDPLPAGLASIALAAAPAALPAAKPINEASVTVKKVDLVPPAPVLPRLAATPPAVKPTNEPSAAVPTRVRSRLLIGGAVLVVGVATAAFLFQHFQKSGVRRILASASNVDRRPRATKVFWDQVQKIEQTGTQTARTFSFEQFPKLPSGMYDFQLINNEVLESLVDTLSKRAQHLTRIAQDFASLNQADVDPDLIAYDKELNTEWTSAASLDFNAANLAWAVHERRIRFPDADASTLGLFDASDGENRALQENRENQDHIAKIEYEWLGQRDQFLALGTKIEAKEKEIHALLAGRYKTEFK